MSRSYRKQPFWAVCGKGSAKQDKQCAARSVRHKQNRYLRERWQNEEFLIPDIYECRFNNTYLWSRDGNQRWNGITKQDTNYWWPERYGSSDIPSWYRKMMRK